MFLSGAQGASPATVLGGVGNTSALIPLSGFLTTAPALAPVEGAFALQGVNDVSQPLPAAVTVNSIYFNAKTTGAFALVGTTVSITATLWVDNVATTLTCADILTGIVGPGTIISCNNVLPDPVVITPGAQAFLAISATVLPGIDTANIFNMRVSTGVGTQAVIA